MVMMMMRRVAVVSVIYVVVVDKPQTTIELPFGVLQVSGLAPILGIMHPVRIVL